MCICTMYSFGYYIPICHCLPFAYIWFGALMTPFGTDIGCNVNGDVHLLS